MSSGIGRIYRRIVQPVHYKCDVGMIQEDFTIVKLPGNHRREAATSAVA